MQMLKDLGRFILGTLILLMLVPNTFSLLTGAAFQGAGSESYHIGRFMGSLFGELLLIWIMQRVVLRVGKKKSQPIETPSGPPTPPKELLQLRERQQQEQKQNEGS